MYNRLMKYTKAVIVGIITLSFLVAAYTYSLLPGRVVTHWGLYGEPNGYSSRFAALFFMPLLSVGMSFLFLFLPGLDPLKENIQKFRKYYELFVMLIMGFLFYLYLLSIAWNLGYTFNMIQFLTPAFGILIYCIGILLENTKRNWFVGIRTPWTLSSDTVWKKTHRIGAKLFKISSLFAFVGLFFPSGAFFLFVVPLVLSSLYLFVYSYFEYKRLTEAG